MSLIGIIILAIFATVIIIATLEKMNRAVISLLGAIVVHALLVLYHGLSPEEILQFIDYRVLIAIIGISIIVEVTRESGLFQYIAIKAVKLSKGEPIPLLIILCLMSYALATVATAIVAIIIMGTLTIAISRILRIDPVPYLIAEAIVVDVGGMTLLFSSIPNIILSQSVGLGLDVFIKYAAPFSIVSLTISIVIIYSKFRYTLDQPDELRKMLLLEFDEWALVRNRSVFYRSAVLFSLVIMGLLLYRDIAFVAITGAALMLAITGIEVDEVLKRVDWETILFFSGLFVIVGGLEHEGLLEALGHSLGELTGGNLLFAMLLTLWLVGILSGVIDNVPIVLAFIPVINALIKTSGASNFAEILWVTMILATNLGGNFLPYGAPTTVLAMGIGRKAGKSFRAKDFIKIGPIWTLSNLVVATFYLLGIVSMSYIIEKIGFVPLILLLTSLGTAIILITVYKFVGFDRLYLILQSLGKKIRDIFLEIPKILYRTIRLIRKKLSALRTGSSSAY
ncbi:MAG: SLC13 family permease [Candidatus Njordarchaeales archaeon]